LEVSISPDGKRAITGSADASVLLWDLSGDTPRIAAHLQGHSGPITALAVSPRGSLVTGSTDKTARLWDFRGLWLKPLDELVKSACHTAGRNLSLQEWHYYLPGRPYQEICPERPIPGK
jgi:WD40 repeat protein